MIMVFSLISFEDLGLISLLISWQGVISLPSLFFYLGVVLTISRVYVMVLDFHSHAATTEIINHGRCLHVIYIPKVLLPLVNLMHCFFYLSMGIAMQLILKLIKYKFFSKIPT